ncbi:helix-turn-helix transcriptional regulator [Herbaspirillum sp. GCM10030257]|uniref:helix-turn-helix transcriptional regulator n=1 Tax=Herbaspirillum sp. GCM10030257 TaxID=3273393 RepID=UPI00361E35D4
MVKQDQLLTLSGKFYEGILAPQGWQDAMMHLAGVTASEMVSLLLWNRMHDQIIIGDAVGMDPALRNDYETHYQALDPGKEFVNRARFGEWYLDERDVAPQIRSGSAFYQDFMRRHRISGVMATPILRARSGTDGLLSLVGQRPHNSLVQVASSLSPLLPHIQQAANLRWKLIELSSQLDLATRVLDRVRFPLLVMNAAGDVRMANTLGQQWLSSSSCLPGQRVEEDDARQRLQAAIRAACGLAGPKRASGAKLARPDGSPCVVSTVPLPAQAESMLHSLEPLALLLVSEPQSGAGPANDLLKEVFYLSPAEIRVTRILLRGLTLKNACEELTISIETGRKHLKSVFNKVGVHRQSDLQRVLGSLDLI